MLQFERVTLAQPGFALRADWTLPAGRMAAVIGPSGAGKSTLLNAVAGFFAPQSGRILWQGRDLAPLAPGARPVAMLFQDQNLFPHLDVSRNLMLALTPSLWPKARHKQAVQAALARVGLDGFGARRPGALSGGQLARAALARVLLMARPVVLLDEPFAALGPALRAEMLALTRAVVAETGATLLMVTHDVGDARALGDLAVFVEGGIVHPPKAVAQLLDAPPPALAAYLGGYSSQTRA